MKKLSCLASILAVTLTSCATTPTLDPQGNYVSPNHTFSVKVPASMHATDASADTRNYEYLDLANGSMGRGYEIFQGGIQRVEWISANSRMTPGVYMHDKHSPAQIFPQFERYVQAESQSDQLDIQHTSVKRINGYRAYEIEGVGKQGKFATQLIATAIVMPTATAIVFSMLSITDAEVTGAAWNARYQTLKAAHYELAQSVQQL